MASLEPITSEMIKRFSALIPANEGWPSLSDENARFAFAPQLVAGALRKEDALRPDEFEPVLQQRLEPRPDWVHFHLLPVVDGGYLLTVRVSESTGFEAPPSLNGSHEFFDDRATRVRLI